MIEISDILNGINEEIRSTPDFVEFKIKQHKREGVLCRINNLVTGIQNHYVFSLENPERKQQFIVTPRR